VRNEPAAPFMSAQVVKVQSGEDGQYSLVGAAVGGGSDDAAGDVGPVVAFAAGA
jgi:hypothetical protein